MIEIDRVNHIGIRVADAARAVAFYGHIGFEKTYEGGPEPVAILDNGNGVEINLIVNANDMNDGRNVLMDVDAKYPGYTHVALQIASAEQTAAALAELGIEIAEGPARFGEGISLFIRDPDRNVVELRQATA